MTAHAPLTGVNLGGWLVLEEWITPSVFAGTAAVDEYTLCEIGDKKTQARLKHFRDTFITEKDFEWLATNGVSLVRLPVGYWVFGNAAPFEPTVAYVDKAFQWAKETGVRILLDLHGAPGSQNGEDHSGRKGSVGWHRDPAHSTATLDVLQKLGARYGKHPALQGIALLNEPKYSIPKAALLNFYQRAYQIVRKTCGDSTWIVYSDAYMPVRWSRVLPKKTYKNVYMDFHYYQIFSPVDKLLPVWVNLLRTRWWLAFRLKFYAHYHSLIIGEWCLTIAGPGRRTPELAQHYAQVQQRAFRHSAATCFWTYRTEAGDTWSFRDCKEKGLLDQ